MDNLPGHLIIEILNRLNDSTELARCRCVSKTLNSLARQVRSIHLYCSLDRYNKMRSPENMSKVTPFKTIFDKLISGTDVPIESVSLGLYKSLNCLINCDEDYDEDLEDECDDMFLSDDDFTSEWLKKSGDKLKSILIGDFRAQSYGRSSHLCDLVSNSCHNLVELELQNACLSVKDMHLMPLLTRFTLKSVKIFDDSLNKLMECLPCLQVLNMFESFVVDTDPKIHHLNMKELKWTLPNCPDTFFDLSSLAISAPSLTKLELNCEVPITVSIHAPLLSYFDLTLGSATESDVKKFKTLQTLRLESSELRCILSTFPRCTTVQNLTIDSPTCYSVPCDKKIELSDVFTIFPKVSSLTLGSVVCSQLMLCPVEPSSPVEGLTARLKRITVYLMLDDFDKTLTFILYVKGICSKLTDIVLFIDCDVDLSVATSFVSSCMSLCPKVRFSWGTWKKRTKGCCIISRCVDVPNNV